ncbi:VanW family protein [Oceanobacillus sp. CFH 90083]|uniref:VanW family protein n=1 Tax=Oceanobacillus sp. CFH 90083 TaxID=2592336 RepID=UPI00128C78DB|nr:VanW family protein [Oceanobacillus sp. CFH 90083]
MRVIVLLLIFLFLLFPHTSHAAVMEFYDEQDGTWLIDLKPYILEVDEALLNWNHIQDLTKHMQQQVFKEPENAYIDDNGEIVKEKPGSALDVNKFHDLINEAYYSEVNKRLHVPKQTVPARVNEALLKEIKEQQLNRFTTRFREGNVERTRNIELAAAAINNTVIFPGEHFSFNEIVGERTRERGYLPAPVIVKGEFSEDIGGGICQVSSTLFNAVDLQGIEITERYAHSREVPYVPKGRDATVSWWGPDFAFRNKYNQPVLIQAAAKEGEMTVAIYTSNDASLFQAKSP